MLHVAKLQTGKLLILAACGAATLALAGCGHSDKAGETASADNVEMPAEETMSGLNPSAVPQADPSATATDQPAGADASAVAADAAAGTTLGTASAPPVTPSPTAQPSTAQPSPAVQASPAAPIQM